MPETDSGNTSRMTCAECVDVDSALWVNFYIHHLRQKLTYRKCE